ncbi:MAG: LacI family transcriptional regulator [Chloroflexi bacterium]|nr:LacI family transcriptional regulator [Chloroflexota bacterium]
MKKPTLEDVAQAAGVSRATVSRVINTPDTVTPELRVRVEQAIAQLGYQPNLVARSLASRRTNILGLIIPCVAQSLFTDPYYPGLIQSIAQASNANGQTLSLFLFHTREEEEQVYRRAIGSGLVDGLIVTAEEIDNPYFLEIVEREIPFVYIGRPHTHIEHINYVNVDNVGGAYIATDHLINLGYRRIAMIAALMNTTTGLDRYQGYCDALADHAVALEKDLVAVGDFSRESGYQAMLQLLPAEPDAVFVANDSMATGALQAIREAKLTVPGDIALVSFDDLPPAANANPPLTTVRQPVHRLGTIAVETLIDVLANGLEPARHTILPTELVIRASCGAGSRVP